MRNSYIAYRRRSRRRLVLMIAGIFALIILIAFLFVYIIQRSQPQKNTLSANGSAVSAVSIASSGGTSTLGEDTAQMKDWRLVLVNSTHKLPNNFQLHIVHDFDMDMDQRIVQPYTDMYKAALQDNIKLWISAAYRSPELQTKLFNNEVQKNIKAGMSSSSANEKAKTAVALPYYSEHHTGLAMDLNGVETNFDKDPAFVWLQKHAAEYGFILRYPKDKVSVTKIIYEPWHYRYVGPEHAKKMNELGMCLEEYIEYLKKNSLN